MGKNGKKRKAVPEAANEFSNKPRKAAKASAAGAELNDDRPVDFLVQPQSTAEFLKDTWEQRPRLFPAKDSAARTQFFKGLCAVHDTFKHAKAQDDADESMQFGLDVNAARYVDGRRETPNGEVANDKTLCDLWEAGCTLQIIQPQRWTPKLMRLVSALEAQLGCLVGCNSYLTPTGTQGLAPHHDDVELWVCQTAGSKTWRLYEPLEGHALPAKPSGDLPEEMLGEPVMEVTLHPGDVLYLPRGTVHQAVAVGEGPSGHLTISTYQRWTYADLLACLLETAAGSGAEETALPLRLRRGLPFDFLASHGLQASLRKRKPEATACSSLAAGLRALADDLEKRPDLIDEAADVMAEGFMRARAPPIDADIVRPIPPAPSASCSLAAASNPGTFRLVPCSEEDMRSAGGDDEDIDEGGYVRMMSCLHNDGTSHMIARPPPEHNFDADGCGDPGCGHDHHHDHSSDEGSEGEQSGSGSDDEPPQLVSVSAGASDAVNGAAAGRQSRQPEAGSAAAQSGKKQQGQQKADAFEEEEGEEDSGNDSDADSDDGVDEIVLPAAHAAAAAALLRATPAKPLAVKDIPLDTMEERLTLAHAMWDAGAVRVVK